MSTLVWWIVGVVVLVLILIGLGLAYLRTRGLHSKKMADEQARLAKKTGKKAPEGPPPTPPASTNGNGKRFGWLRKKPGSGFWTFLLIVAAIVVFYCGIYSPSWETPSFGSIGNLALRHWFWILILAAILAILIARVGGGMKKTLNGFLVVVLIAIFVIIPAGVWIMTPRAPTSHVQVPLASEPFANWKKFLIPAGGRQEIPISQGTRRAMINGSRITIVSRYADGTECARDSEGPESISVLGSCPDGMVGSHVINKANETNVVLVAYEK